MLLSSLAVLSVIFAAVCLNDYFENEDASLKSRAGNLALAFVCGLFTVDSILRLVNGLPPAAGTGLAIAALLYSLFAEKFRSSDPTQKEKQGMQHVHSQACRPDQ